MAFRVKGIPGNIHVCIRNILPRRSAFSIPRQSITNNHEWGISSYLTIGIAIVTLIVAIATFVSNRRSEQIASIALRLDSTDRRQDTIIDNLSRLFANSKNQLDSIHDAINELTSLNTKSQQQLNLQQVEFSLFSKADQRNWEQTKQQIDHMSLYMTSFRTKVDQYDNEAAAHVTDQLKMKINEVLSLLQKANSNRYIVSQPYIFNKIAPLSEFLNRLLTQIMAEDGLQEVIRRRFKRGLETFIEYIRRPSFASSDKDFKAELLYVEDFSMTISKP
jgi:hypothetical protein